MKIQVEVFWLLRPCSDVVGYQRFGGSWLLFTTQKTAHYLNLHRCRNLVSRNRDRYREATLYRTHLVEIKRNTEMQKPPKKRQYFKIFVLLFTITFFSRAGKP
jgi:hypothetical protein